ncbi:MAG: FG-GAP-like repeat-containing protein [Vicinamibacterales bacterium]
MPAAFAWLGGAGGDRLARLNVAVLLTVAIALLQAASSYLNAGFRIADPARTPYALAVGDLNNDGSPDIVLGYTSGPDSVLLNDGSGHAFTEVRFGDQKGSAYGFALGDVNGDRFLDIALARSGAPNVHYLSGK